MSGLSKIPGVLRAAARPLLAALALALLVSSLGRLRDGVEGRAQAAVSPPPSDMILVPAGQFWVGCAGSTDAQCEEPEKPGHTMRLESFWIDRHEVTVAEYRACVQASACSSSGLGQPVWFNGEKHPELAWACNWGKPGRDSHPIDCVSWYQARDYCTWVGKRLPTDAEWTKAARGDTDRRIYPWGDERYGRTAVANILDESARVTFPTWPIMRGYDDGAVATAPVGSYPLGASPSGALDMIGNVEEWTSDWYDQQKGLRSIRGSSWHRSAEHGRISRLYPSEPGSHPDYGGFRCARARERGNNQGVTAQ